MLSKRLYSLVRYIEIKDKVIDIGCDHALLDIYLVKNKIQGNMIVSDIHENALKSGIENIKKHKLSKKIEARLGNGLEVLNENDRVDTILISGMGTSTIISILSHEYIKKVNKLIIQSNNNHEELREYLTKNGFFIASEDYLVDNKKNYINIVFERGIRKYKKDEIKYGPILIKNKEYLNFELNNCLKIKGLIKNPKLKQRYILNKEIRRINKYISEVNR